MDSARQALRWTIPGWLFFLFLVMFEGMRIVFGFSSPLWETITAIPALSVGIAAAGLPVGFLIYQIYYWMYWVFPFPAILGLGQPEDRAQHILKDVLEIDFDQIAAHLWNETPINAVSQKKFGPVKIHFKDRKIMMQYRDNWLLATFMWNKTLLENKLQSLEREAQGYADIYHSLGTGRWALVLAFGFHTYLAIAGTWGRLAQVLFWVALAINLFLVWLFFQVLTAARYDTLSTLLQFEHDIITYFHRFPVKRSAPEK